MHVCVANMPVKMKMKRSSWKLVGYIPDVEDVMDSLLAQTQVTVKLDEDGAVLRTAIVNALMQGVWKEVIAQADDFRVGEKVFSLRLAPMAVDKVEAWRVACVKQMTCILCTETNLGLVRPGKKERPNCVRRAK